jgi:cytochrome c553
MTNNRRHVCVLALSGFIAISSFAHAELAIIGVCAGCHGADGSGAGLDNVPIIAGTPAAHLEEAVYAYLDGARQCIEVPAMCAIVATLSESDIAELAEHYGAMTRHSSGEAFDETLAQTGARIHKKHCSKCHVRPDDEDVENALGIPLHGQRSAYLKYALNAYLTGDREVLLPAMAHELAELDADAIEALIHHYASYESP